MPQGLMESPRHWNCGLMLHEDRLWLCYRYHQMNEAGRCQTAMVELDRKTLQPCGPNQRLDLGGKLTDHQEDARLFIYQGEPHISYTEMTGYQPGVDYKCVIKYARLRYSRGRWKAGDIFQPLYGRNTGMSKEKNWTFFDHDGTLYCIYEDAPRHRVIQISGDRIKADFTSPPPHWPWGVVRGGASPVRIPGLGWLVLFHSSLPTEEPPHYVRYFGAAYVMEEKPPFAVTRITARPIMAGSEADGHGFDPRYAEGWKPYVVFPSGCVPDGDRLLVALGVNDWQCAVARMKIEQFPFVAADGTGIHPRYFRTANGTLPIRIITPDNQIQWLHWQVGKPGHIVMAPPGYLEVMDMRVAEDLSELAGVEEIDREQYARNTDPRRQRSALVV